MIDARLICDESILLCLASCGNSGFFLNATSSGFFKLTLLTVAYWIVASSKLLSDSPEDSCLVRCAGLALSWTAILRSTRLRIPSACRDDIRCSQTSWTSCWGLVGVLHKWESHTSKICLWCSWSMLTSESSSSPIDWGYLLLWTEKQNGDDIDKDELRRWRLFSRTRTPDELYYFTRARELYDAYNNHFHAQCTSSSIMRPSSEAPGLLPSMTFIRGFSFDLLLSIRPSGRPRWQLDPRSWILTSGLEPQPERDQRLDSTIDNPSECSHVMKHWAVWAWTNQCENS